MGPSAASVVAIVALLNGMNPTSALSLALVLAIVVIDRLARDSHSE